MPGSILGNPVRRREDPALLTGRASYTGDLKLTGCLHAAFVRSPHAHARVQSLDTSAAASLPGVVQVITATDLDVRAIAAFPFLKGRPALAAETVRFVGEPVAALFAETRETAVDAAANVLVDWEPLPAVVDPAAGEELRVDHVGEGGGALEGADVVVTGRFMNQRLAPVPMEPNAFVAAPDPETGGMKIWASTQVPHGLRDRLAGDLTLPPERVRVIAPAVGGGFGAKGDLYPEYVIVAVMAQRLGRPIMWVETRWENMVGMVHGRGQVQEVTLGAASDGRLVGIQARITADLGAYQGIQVILPGLTGMMSAGVYNMPKVDFSASLRHTHTTPMGAYRGAGRPEAAAMLERAMDLLAVELEMDPAELRRRNMIQPEAFPVTTASGAPYDSGNYPAALDAALQLAGYTQLRREQAERRQRGDRLQLGIGLATYVEITGAEPLTEFAAVEIDDQGKVTVRSGTSPHGQGHETTFAQITAEVLGVPMDSIRVIQSDTAEVPRGVGTFGSRSVQLGGTAVHVAAEKVLDDGRERAADLLEANPADIVVVPGRGLGVAGAPQSVVGWAEIARAAGGDGLKVALDQAQPGPTFPFGCHVAVVEVDIETGDARLVNHVAVDDSGHIINPLLADGQIQGGIAQGVAQALYEEVVFDDQGNPQTASLIDYLIPTACEMPKMALGRTVTPSPHNALGAKGIGESGTIGSTPAVQNAVIDAVAHLGVRHIDMPLAPERVWRMIQAARATATDAGRSPRSSEPRPN